MRAKIPKRGEQRVRKGGENAGRPRRSDWQEPFLEVFRHTGVIATSARAVRVDVATVKRERQRDEAFALAFREAEEEAADNLERIAHERATIGQAYQETTRTTRTLRDGKVETIEVVKEGRHLSDTVLMFRLKALRPEKYRDNARLELTGANGGPIQAVRGLELADALTEDEVESMHAILQRAAERSARDV